MSKKAKAFWTLHGFQEISTGGNCTAWERTIKGDGFKPVQILVTDKDNQAPQRFSESHAVGLYLEGEGEHFAYSEQDDALNAWLWIKDTLAMPKLQ